MNINKKLLDIFKKTKTTSDTDTYSCNYMNTQLGNKQPLVNYSTSEVDTGVKWIDGKTIYRKVITTNLTSTSNRIVRTLSSLGLNNIGTIIELNSFLQGNPKEQDYYAGSDDRLRTLINNEGLTIEVGNSYPTRPVTIYTIVEYTKTTD